MMRERELASDEQENQGGAESDEEVADEAYESGAMTHGESCASEDAAGDALEDSDGGYAAEAIKDKSIRDVQRADQERGTGDDLPKRWAIDGHCHLE